MNEQEGFIADICLKSYRCNRDIMVWLIGMSIPETSEL